MFVSAHAAAGRAEVQAIQGGQQRSTAGVQVTTKSRVPRPCAVNRMCRGAFSKAVGEVKCYLEGGRQGALWAAAAAVNGHKRGTRVMAVQGAWRREYDPLVCSAWPAFRRWQEERGINFSNRSSSMCMRRFQARAVLGCLRFRKTKRRGIQGCASCAAVTCASDRRQRAAARFCARAQAGASRRRHSQGRPSCPGRTLAPVAHHRAASSQRLSFEASSSRSQGAAHRLLLSFLSASQ